MDDNNPTWIDRQLYRMDRLGVCPRYYRTLPRKHPRRCGIRDRDNITHADLMRLQPGRWISSTLLLAMREMLNLDGADGGRVFCTDPLFVTYLQRRAFAHIDDVALRPARVRAETADARSDALDHQHVVSFVNVNGNHWVLLDFDVRARRVLVRDSLLSLGADHGPLLEVAREWAERRTREEWDADVDAAYPQQDNGWDCGVFAMTSAFLLARGRPLEFGQRNMDLLRVFFTYSIKQDAFVF